MIHICSSRARQTLPFVTRTSTVVQSSKRGEIAWPRKATLLCAKTKRSKREQGMRRQPLSVRQPRLRPTSERTTPIPHCLARTASESASVVTRRVFGHLAGIGRITALLRFQNCVPGKEHHASYGLSRDFISLPVLKKGTAFCPTETRAPVRGFLPLRA